MSIAGRAAEHPLLPHLCLRKAPALLGRMRRPQISQSGNLGEIKPRQVPFCLWLCENGGGKNKPQPLSLLAERKWGGEMNEAHYASSILDLIPSYFQKIISNLSLFKD
jgi:hypothetical protein